MTNKASAPSRSLKIVTKTSLLQGLGYWFFLPSYNHVIKIVKDTWLGAVTVKGSLASRAGK